ncbi:MAG: argininosuccinate lyase [Acidobacteria bacterium]|nr:MAG: argininosuccinate lyase [Acidobacteria bacterium 13_1_40CM_4_58_4]PYT59479.1 MAG: argininosuccinate lyase [Acidobacteriota bacterium]
MAERKDDRLWGGRFEREPNAQFDAFQRSFAFDRRLLPYEIAVDRAWAKALEPIRIFTATELKQTLAALDKIAERTKTDSAWVESFGASAEDVHHFVEKALVEELGPLGWKLHTGRSRNEVIATDFRLFVMDAAAEMRRGLEALLNAFLLQAKANISVPMAGMTHMQHAQPILLSHFLLAHAEAFTRDITRLQHASASADACPMGSGALAGNSFAIDRNAIARELGFSRITANSLDAVSDRDFALDYLFALAGIATHLSRLAEDFVVFASQEFSYVTLPDEFSTGSSLMPQKKNPDAWELIRGKTGRITGALLSLLTTLKGLPTSYQRDLQEDKEALFGAHDQVEGMVWIAMGALTATKFNADRLRAAASNPVLFATDAADYLVHKGVPFRKAHDLVGQVLREAERQGKPWTQLSLEDVQKISPLFEKDFLDGPSVEDVIANKIVPGGTAPESVRAAIADLEARLSKKTTKTGAKP